MDKILQQIKEVESWLRDHPDADAVSRSEMIGRLRELNERLNAEKLAGEWINELTEAGFTPDEMVFIFRQARKQYGELKKQKLQ